jgi:hypoxanthine phosphoribosyltransferase
MKRITVHDKEFTPHIPHVRIESAIVRIAGDINRDLDGANPLFVVVLNGAFMFAAELFKHVRIECDIAFTRLSSYCGTASTAYVRELIGLDQPVAGRAVVLVEDIVDTGMTMHVMLEKLRLLKAGRVKIATLLFKPEAFQHAFPIDYIGMDIPDDFIIGYGLDYHGRGRNLPDMYKLACTQQQP